MKNRRLGSSFYAVLPCCQLSRDVALSVAGDLCVMR